jgi:hypothetical protein
MRAMNPRQFRAFRNESGKSLFAQGCVVADAVSIEPVSSRKYPGNREITANFGEMATPWRILAHDLTNKFNDLRSEFPNRETGNFFKVAKRDLELHFSF